MICVMKITTISSSGSTQNNVLASPPHEYTPREVTVGILRLNEQLAKDDEHIEQQQHDQHPL